MPEKQQATFKLVKKGEEISDDRGNVLIVSHQEIIQPNNSKSEHLVISKVRRNVDGTQQGKAKSLFIPRHLISNLVESIDALEL